MSAASGASEVVEALLSEGFDLVLLDIRIPVFNGREIFEALRQYEPKLKIIVCSVYPVDEQKKTIPHADDYFDKSQGTSILTEKVLSFLSSPEKNYRNRDNGSPASSHPLFDKNQQTTNNN